MTILSWETPKKLLPPAEHNDKYVADGAPSGVYVPNMSADDMYRWKAKLVGTRTGYPRIEIRKTITGVQMLVIVSLGEGVPNKRAWGGMDMYEDANVKISANGSIQMDWQEFEDLRIAVTEAKFVLENRLKDAVEDSDDDVKEPAE